MPDETQAPAEVPENGIHSLDSSAMRFVPPAAIALAWWLSGIELITPPERGQDWKILAVAFAVFWLAACGSRLVALWPKQVTWVAAALVVVGLVSGCFASGGSYGNHIFYGATHALFIASLGLFIFVAMTRREKNQTPDKSAGATAAPPPIQPSEPPKTVKTKS